MRLHKHKTFRPFLVAFCGILGSIKIAKSGVHPILNSVNPPTGYIQGGNTVILNGANLYKTATVTFGGTPAKITKATQMSLEVTVPRGQALGPVAIQATWASGASGILAKGYTYTNTPPPRITSIVYSTGPKAGGITENIKGSAFSGIPTVLFGTHQSPSVQLASSTQLEVVTPPSPTEGLVNVKVTNPDGGHAILANGYRFTSANPVILSVSPATGYVAGRNVVEVQGTHLFYTATLTFGGRPAKISSLTQTSLIATVPPGRTVGPVDVRASWATGETGALPNGYRYTNQPPPQITSIAYTSGPKAGGITETMTGSGFWGNPVVLFGTLAAQSVRLVSATQLKVVAPASPAAGLVNVKVVNPDGGSATLASGYRYTSVDPVITSITPSRGFNVGGSTVTVNGSNLYHTAVLTFGGVPATIVKAAPTYLKVIVPAYVNSATANVGAVDVRATWSTGETGKITKGYVYTPTVSPGSLPAGFPGISYNQQLSATGGLPPYTWSIASGQLPAGLTLDPKMGLIAGRPAASYQTYSFTISATESSQSRVSANVPLSIAIQIGLKPGPIPATLFGMTLVVSPKDWPTIPFGTFGKGGATSFAYTEPRAEQFNWARLDEYLAQAQSHKMDMYWTTWGVPPWAAAQPSSCRTPAGSSYPICSSNVANIEDWDDYITALVTRYKGQIKMYELWNEPDRPYSFTGTLEEMIMLNQHMYELVRSIDPAALIASPSIVDNPYIRGYWTATNPAPPKGIDVIDIHGYPDVPVQDAPEAIVDFKTILLKSTLIQAGLAATPIWDSESSWGRAASSNQDPDFRAGYLARAYLLHWSAGVERLYWYAWDDPVWGTLWSPASGITQAGIAYGQVYNWMVGATMPQPCGYTGSSVYQAVYTCPLRRPGGYQALAVWDTTQACTNRVCTTSSYTPDVIYQQFRDLSGNVTRIQPGQILQIGSKPILLEN